MSDGTTSVEDAVDELNSSKMDSLYFHSVSLNLSNYRVIYDVPTNQGGALYASAIVAADASLALPTAIWNNGTKISVNGYNQNITATQAIILAYFSDKS